MQYRNLGRSGLKISALSYGAWVTFDTQADVDLAYDMMVAAFDAGVNFFDNAEVYAEGKAETIMGAALERAGWRREEYVVSTKIFWGNRTVNEQGLSRKHIVEGTNAALTRLGLDYVDLIFCHRPDMHTPVEETVRAMAHVVDQGKALYWGTSEWSAERIRHAYEFARREHLVPPLMEQPQYNMLCRDRIESDYVNLYRDCGLGTTIWSPLASGILTGKYDDGIPAGSRLALDGYDWLKKKLEGDDGARTIAKVKALEPIADDLGLSRAQLALAWCLRNPNVSTVITGASRPEQVTENMKAMDAVGALTDDVMARIDDVLQNRPEPEKDFRSAS